MPSGKKVLKQRKTPPSSPDAQSSLSTMQETLGAELKSILSDDFIGLPTSSELREFSAMSREASYNTSSLVADDSLATILSAPPSKPSSAAGRRHLPANDAEKESVVEEPTREQPAAEQPAGEEPAEEEPVVEVADHRHPADLVLDASCKKVAVQPAENEKLADHSSVIEEALQPALVQEPARDAPPADRKGDIRLEGDAAVGEILIQTQADANTAVEPVAVSELRNETAGHVSPITVTIPPDRSDPEPQSDSQAEVEEMRPRGAAFSPGTPNVLDFSVDEIVAMLLDCQSCSPHFTGFSLADLSYLAEYLCITELLADELLMSQGEEALFMGIVLRGKLKLGWRPGEDNDLWEGDTVLQSVTSSSLTKGALVGEFGMFMGGVRKANVMSLGSDTRIAVLDFVDLKTLFYSQPAVVSERSLVGCARMFEASVGSEKSDFATSGPVPACS
ncbi:hypothetical protein CYMTET_42510 [Cymbomonas tetramitiformis]|uniref:Cyclic nucleotide-binding domain-containing protein n=1 Tax=Cymbomonas tetramitiformis TaxID=36881 RepID=A0AAE0C5Y5_9CHLO|nr:hypothetical protein CYMTET_42510 [Cymbomonas tetramitiformis]